MVITLSPEDGERYQGMVEVKPTDSSLADVIERYFTQSEQLQTRVWLHADETHVGGLLLQSMPGEDDPERGCEHLAALTATMTANELFNLDATEVLHRLYHEEEVILYEPAPVRFFCGCSRERSMNALYSVSVDELRDIIQTDGEIKLTCDYCLTEYVYNEEDLGVIQGHNNENLQ